MRSYELVALLHPDLEIDVDTPVVKLEKLVETAEGKIIKRDNWGKKRLAYKINKLDFAVYVYFELQFLPEKVKSFEQDLRLTEEVIRYLLVAQSERSSTSRRNAKKSETDAKPAGVSAESPVGDKNNEEQA
jgi:small subunit ribosomal protein S6